MSFTNIFLGIIVLTSFALLSSYETFAEQSKIEKILPTDDAHVLADLSDPADSSGLMHTNVGNLDSIQMVSAWNTTKNNNAYVSIVYLKFDISQQNLNNLEKAELKLLSRDVSLSETPKKVALLHVPNNNWKESDITYLKRPFFSTTIASSAEVSSPNTWYSWDVTPLVMQNPGSELSVALTFEVGKDNTQDYVSFYSKEAADPNFRPFLELTFTPKSAFSNNAESSSISLYAGIAIAACGILAGYFISKRSSKY